MSRRWQTIAVSVLVAIVAIALFGRPLLHLLAELWWFEAVGFAPVFWTRATWQVGIWCAAFAIYLLGLGGNYWLAKRWTQPRDIPLPLERRLARTEYLLFRMAMALGVVAVASVAATLSVQSWETILKALNATPFQQTDPIFGLDLGFYVFQLPLYEGGVQWLAGLFVCSLLLVLALYGLEGDIDPRRNWQSMVSRPAKFHISLLLAAIAILLSIYFWLQRYDLLYSPEGVVFGAGFTDVNARLPLQAMASILTAILSGILLVSLWQRSPLLPVGCALVYFVLLSLANLYPPILQRFVVEPNELTEEMPYVAHNIAFTQAAYGLEDVDSRAYPVEAELTREVLDRNQLTVGNIRLWDYRPLLSTYRQLQEIRPYYHFSDVDVDRYTLDGTYQQVMLAPREVDASKLAPKAQTWVNRRLHYTHGFGLVMSPVTRVSPNGLPELIVRNIPPVTEVDLEIDQPRIYYGEVTHNYIFTGATSDEFDYPLGDETAKNRYSGRGGVPLSPWYRRLAYSLELNSWNTFASNSLTADSRIHYHRNIRDRVRQVAPFLSFDSDPYIVAIDGGLKWIVDAYTLSSRYPYSEPLWRSDGSPAIFEEGTIGQMFRQGSNYIRNSVKVVVDAYDGTMTFWAIDDRDPLLATYRKIFPTLFANGADVPEALEAHFRYPVDLFKIQSQLYLSYHISDPAVFYNGEDLWSFPKEVFQSGEQLMQPYYVIMRLPEEEAEEFVLIWPFTPLDKSNMVAWMAARSDGEQYGKLLLYEFPRQELIFGPRQIEARIDQTPEISEQLTLWSQQGSRVIRGDLLVIPIERSLLYVEPIFLSAEEGALPELQRVIVAYDDRIVMANRLPEALTAVFGPETEPETIAVFEGRSPRSDTRSLDGDARQKIREALETYERAIEAQREGDWAVYGRMQEALGELLQQLDSGDEATRATE
ncbi:UPF0182 family protein [Synechococcus sp. PCC 7336]|uniref:UPF0182 family membrane protein n=1 Tax=Synechococcus sp. PCC 7336 TaxID=195250 RepID=UPI000348C2F7|nr:UPF0182 family protein [Synechococcus sp. PCC 7336]